MIALTFEPGPQLVGRRGGGPAHLGEGCDLFVESPQPLLVDAECRGAGRSAHVRTGEAAKLLDIG